jgi:hypothetical protein
VAKSSSSPYFSSFSPEQSFLQPNTSNESTKISAVLENSTTDDINSVAFTVSDKANEQYIDITDKKIDKNTITAIISLTGGGIELTQLKTIEIKVDCKNNASSTTNIVIVPLAEKYLQTTFENNSSHPLKMGDYNSSATFTVQKINASN